MTISTFLNSHLSTPKFDINDRGEPPSYFHPSWKGGSKGGGKLSQSAISALTLLAFLFFLNILQSCLKDQLQSQAPLTIMMTTTTTTTTTEGRRQTRETESNPSLKGDPDLPSQIHHQPSTGYGDNEQPCEGEENKYEEVEITTDEDDFERISLKEGNRGKQEHSWETTSEAITRDRKSELEDMMKRKRRSPAASWLQTVLCCAILDCPLNHRPETSLSVHHLSRLTRKNLGRLCGRI